MDTEQERQPLLANRPENNVNTEELSNKDVKTASPNQTILRSVNVLLFVLALEIGSLNQNQYIYRWVQNQPQNNASLQTHYRQNDSSGRNCGKNISDYKERADQKMAAEWIWYFAMTEHGVAVFVVIFYGIYSDYIGRKPLVAISVFGFILRYGIASYIVYYELHLMYFFVAYALCGICGCHYTFYIGNMASIADKTERNRRRSIGLAILESMLGMGASIGHLGTGYLIDYTGFLFSNLVTTGVCLLDLILILCFLTETIDRVSTKDLSFKSGCKRMFGFYYDKLKITDGRNWKFNACISAFFFLYFIHGAKTNVETLYQMRSPFCWDAVIIGWYGFVVDIGMYILGLTGMRALQIFTTDESIAFIGILSNISFAAIEGVASTSWMLYVAAGTGTLSIVPFPLLRSICSSMVPENLQGALFSNFYVIENLCSLFYSTFSSNIYAATQSFMPGLVFLIISAMFLIPISVLLPVIFCNKKEKSELQKLKIQTTSFNN